MARKSVLITGFAGGLAQTTGSELRSRGYQVTGVDYRPLKEKPDYPFEFCQANYNKTRIEDVFRRHKPSAVLHLGRVGNLKVKMGKRFDLNVVGSAKVQDLCLKYEVRRLVVLSTFHIYGAHPHNHTPIYEDEPLRAGPEFPQIADAIQLDSQALLWIYRHPELATVLLRPCNVVGPQIRNAMSLFLRQPWLPYMLGFNPMVQFVHADDLAAAIVAVTEGDPVGVYNVAGVSPVPWRDALKIAPGRLLPVPSSFASFYLKVSSLITDPLPSYLINFTKYPCVISDRAIRETFGFEPRLGAVETIRSATFQA